MMYAKRSGPDYVASDAATESVAIMRAADAFSGAMKVKLVEKVREGWRGWDDPANGQEIWTALLAHASGVPLAHEQEIAVANFAMFLWWQRQVCPPAAAAAKAA